MVDAAGRGPLSALVRLSRVKSNPDVQINLVLVCLSLGANASALQLLDDVCPADPLDCNYLAINPTYRALRTSSRFQQIAKKYTAVTLK